MTDYVIVFNKPGYLPEEDPWVLDDATFLEALQFLRGRVEEDGESAQTDDAIAEWDGVLAKLDKDLRRIDQLDTVGAAYELPNGYVGEIRRCRRYRQ